MLWSKNEGLTNLNASVEYVHRHSCTLYNRNDENRQTTWMASYILSKIKKKYSFLFRLVAASSQIFIHFWDFWSARSARCTCLCWTLLRRSRILLFSTQLHFAFFGRLGVGFCFDAEKVLNVLCGLQNDWKIGFDAPSTLPIVIRVRLDHLIWMTNCFFSSFRISFQENAATATYTRHQLVELKSVNNWRALNFSLMRWQIFVHWVCCGRLCVCAVCNCVQLNRMKRPAVESIALNTKYCNFSCRTENINRRI